MKEFDQWNDLKKGLHSSAPKEEFYISKREIWFAHLGMNIGTEQNGKGDNFLRPVLVLKKLGNVYLIIPMTTKGKDTWFYHTLPTSYFGQPSRLILSQIKVIDKKRFLDKVAKLENHDFQTVKKKLKAFLSL